MQEFQQPQQQKKLVKSSTQYLEKLTNDTITGINKMLAENTSIQVPEGYDAPSEVRSAMLYIAQNTKNNSGVPAIECCSAGSIAMALRLMVMQGLSVSKSQTYPIVYANNLYLQNSYFGDMVVFSRVFPKYKTVARVIWEGDTFEIKSLPDGSIRFDNYVTKFENKDNGIAGAFCNIVDIETGEVVFCDYMTAKQIQASWLMSRNKSGSVQKSFPEEMAKRTILRRVIKPFIKSYTPKNANEESVISAYNQSVVSEYDNTATDAEYQEIKTKAEAISKKSKGTSGLSSLIDLDDEQDSIKESTAPDENVVEELFETGNNEDEIISQDIPTDPHFVGSPF